MNTRKQQTTWNFPNSLGQIHIFPRHLFCAFYRNWLWCVGLILLLGCNSDRLLVEKNLMEYRITPAEAQTVLECYRVGATDELAVLVKDRPDWSFRGKVQPDGRLTIPNLGDIYVDGMAVKDATQRIAYRYGVPEQVVELKVEKFNSQQIYIFGEVNGAQQSLPYRGPETVLNLLQRIGGITPAAQPSEVYVVRSNIDEAVRPEVYPIDLNAIVLKKDRSTDIRLEPFDRIYVGETRQSRVERCFPPWLRPLYQALWDTHPKGWYPKSNFRKRIINARRGPEVQGEITPREFKREPKAFPYVSNEPGR